MPHPSPSPSPSPSAAPQDAAAGAYPLPPVVGQFDSASAAGALGGTVGGVAEYLGAPAGHAAPLQGDLHNAHASLAQHTSTGTNAPPPQEDPRYSDVSGGDM